MPRKKAFRYRKYVLKGTWFSLLFMGKAVYRVFAWLASLRHEAISDEGVCPMCGSFKLNYGSAELHDNQVCYPYLCGSCGREGKEWYSMRYIETKMKRLMREQEGTYGEMEF